MRQRSFQFFRQTRRFRRCHSTRRPRKPLQLEMPRCCAVFEVGSTLYRQLPRYLLLWACIPLGRLCPSELMHSHEKSWRDKPANQRTHRTEGLAQTYRAILHCRTGRRGLKSMTEELGDSELSTGGSASVSEVKHCGI